MAFTIEGFKAGARRPYGYRDEVVPPKLKLPFRHTARSVRIEAVRKQFRDFVVGPLTVTNPTPRQTGLAALKLAELGMPGYPGAIWAIPTIDQDFRDIPVPIAWRGPLEALGRDEESAVDRIGFRVVEGSTSALHPHRDRYERVGAVQMDYRPNPADEDQFRRVQELGFFLAQISQLPVVTTPLEFQTGGSFNPREVLLAPDPHRRR